MSDIEAANADTGEAKTFDLRASLEAEAARQMGSDEDNGQGGDDAVAPREDGRDEKGRFAKKEGGDAENAGNHAGDNDLPVRDGRSDIDRGDAEKPGAEDQRSGEAGGSPVTPPPGWSVASKAAWNDLPAAVKADIAKRETEVSDGFRQYQGLGELKPYAEAYLRNGQTIKQAFDGYLNIERGLQTNFVGGVEHICQGFNVDPVRLAHAILQKHGQGAPQGEQQPDPIRSALSPLERQIAELKQERDQERRTAQEQIQSESLAAIQAFAADPKHLYFENVKPMMGHLMSTGQAASMEDAYEKAIWATPEIRQLLLKQQQTEAASQNQAAQRQAAATQARQSARSLTGAPTPGGSSAAHSKPRTIREIAEEAARAQGVSV